MGAVLNSFRYRPFGILRFVLALMVLIQHFYADIAPDAIKQFLFPYAPGNIAVLGFFILSGFIICEAYTHNYQGRPVAYMVNRVMRIFPGYVAALVLSMLVHWLLVTINGHALSMERHDILPIYFGVKNLLLNIFAVFPPVRLNLTETTYPFIPYAWALQTEMMFYLTVFFVGLFSPYLQRLTRLPQNFWFAIAGYGGVLASALVQMDFLPKQLAYGSYFAFGGALFFFLHGHKKALGVLVPALAQMLWHFSDCDAEDFTTITANRGGQFVILLLIVGAFIKLAITKTKEAKIDKAFGELSYPLYLNHYVIGLVILNSVAVFSVTTLVAGLIVSLILTMAMFHGIDKPLTKIRSGIRQQGQKQIL